MCIRDSVFTRKNIRDNKQFQFFIGILVVALLLALPHLSLNPVNWILRMVPPFPVSYTHLKQSAFYMLIPTGMFLMGAFLPSSIYILVFGKTYEASTLITKLLSFAYIPFPFLAALLLFFLYTVKKPHYLLISNGLFFLTIIIVHTLLIPHLRLVAPPISYFTAFIVVTCAMFTTVSYTHLDVYKRQILR